MKSVVVGTQEHSASAHGVADDETTYLESKKQMSKYRRAARTDNNQTEIVKALRQIPGVSVQTGMDDILVGRLGVTYWIELKSERAVSRKTGKVLDSAKKKGQIQLENEWAGHYVILSSLEEILEEIGILTAEG